jgi:8-oxo-dGTP diphosphatase
MKIVDLAGCAIIRNKALLLLWKIKHNHYEFPGGKVNPGETYKAAARREVAEEIGCEVNIINYLGSQNFEFEKILYRSHLFTAEIKPGYTPSILEPESFSNFFWMPIQDYQKYELAPNVKYFCEKYLAE